MTDSRGFHLTRTITASREQVFAAWTEPAELDWFFSEPGADNPAAEIDLRAGGDWRQLMVIDELDSYVTGGRYKLVVPGEKLVFAWGADGGWPELDQSAPIITIDLTGDNPTALESTLRLPDHLSEDEAEELLATDMEQGWSHTLDRLVEHFAPSAG